MKTSIKATILATILATGIGGATCGGLTELSDNLMTNCQYNELKAGLIAKYPTGREVIEIDDWQLLVAVIDKEIKKQETKILSINNANQTNILEKLINKIK